jgi:hypothetical protein
MNEITGLDRFEPVPDTPWHDVRLAGPKQNLRLDAHCLLVTVVKNQFHRSAHDIQVLITVRVDLTTMGSRPIDVGIAPIVYPSIRRGGPGGADVMVIDQSRAMFATLPSKRTGDAFEALLIGTDCPNRCASGLETPDRDRGAPDYRGARPRG